MNQELIIELDNLSVGLSKNEIEQVKILFKTHNAYFVEIIDSVLSKIKKKEDVNTFINLIEQFHEEILSVTHFLAGNINRITALLQKNHFYRQITEIIPFLEICGNEKTLEILTETLSDLQASKYLSSVEIYRLRKLVFKMSNKLKQSDITYKIEVDLQREDLEWLDHFKN